MRVLFSHPGLAFFGLITLLSLTGTVYSQEGKLGYINSLRIRTEYKEFAAAQEKFDKEVAIWQKENEQKQSELDSLQKELESQSLLLSEAKKKEKERYLNQKMDEYKKYFEETFGPNGKAERRNAELTKPILDKINTALEKLATVENYSFICDAVGGNIAYAKKSFDLTDKVLAELNKSQ